MKRIMTGTAFAALALVVVMLLARVAALRAEIARLQGERPEPERVVVEVATPPAAPAALEAAALVEAPAWTGAQAPPAAVDTPVDAAAQAVPMVELSSLQAVEGVPILADLPVVGRMFTRVMAPRDRYEQAGLTPLQRARVVEFERLRDAELEALRQRWDALMQSELTPEQRAKQAQQSKQGDVVLEGQWEVPKDEGASQP
jgi:hypothetical protein